MSWPVGTVTGQGTRLMAEGIDGTSDNDIVLETNDVSRFDVFTFSCGAGTFDVEVYDGKQWLTNPLAMADLGATTTAPVVEGSALRLYGYRGPAQKLRVRQKGATACTGFVLRAKKE